MRSKTGVMEFTPMSIEFDSGDFINFIYAPEFERLDEPFEISPGINHTSRGIYLEPVLANRRRRHPKGPGSWTQNTAGENSMMGRGGRFQWG